MLFLMPAICFVAVAIYGQTDEQWKHRIWLPATIIVVAEYAVLLLLHLLLSHESVRITENIPCLPVAFISALPFSILLSPDWIRKGLKKVLVASLAVFLVEVFILNGKSLTSQYEQWQYLPGDIGVSDPVLCEAENGAQVLNISGNATLTLNNVPEAARCMTFTLQQKQEQETPVPLSVRLTMYDDNSPKNGVLVQEKLQVGTQSVCRLSFQPYGKIHSLRIELCNVERTMLLNGITVASHLPFAFQSIRFWLLLAVVSAVLLTIEYKWYRVRYQRKKPLHLLCIGVTIVLCMSICSAFTKPDAEPYTYENSASTSDPYALTFDAFQKGQVWLDLEPDALLETLENVYCTELRNDSQAFYYWDYAYYQGKYYCYFGVAPVLLYYFPYYWIHDQLPTLSMAVNFFSFWSVLFLILALLAVVRMFHPHPNFLLLLLSIPAVSIGAGAYHMMNYAGIYHLPMSAGLCLLSLCLWTGVSACMKKSMPIRMLLLFISGTALALCFGARQTMALGAVVLIPLFIGILLNKRQKPVWRLSQAVSFLVPLLVGVGGLLYYNQLRFGSVFDFGSTYQLTVSDVHANQVRLTNLWAAMEHYFIIPPHNKTTFPFFEPQFGNLYNYQHYVYLEGTVGWLSYPMIAVGFLCMYPAMAWDRFRYRSCIRNYARRGFLLLCCIMALVIAWLDFSAGGVNQRYLYDIAPLLFIGCTVAILSLCRKPASHRYRYCLLCITVAMSSIFGALLLIGIPDGNLHRRCPEVYNCIETMCMFWQ